MKLIYNKLIPFKGYKILNFFGLLFIRSEYMGTVTSTDINHEMIHSAQIRDLGYLFFYPWYVIEWLIRLIQYGSNAYRNISMEREAYANEKNLWYLEERRPWSFAKYLRKY